MREAAINVVVDRFCLEHSASYARFGVAARDACKEDLAFHLDFLRPVLEFGLPRPMVDYLSWLDSVLVARAIPRDRLAASVDWLTEFFLGHLAPGDGKVVTNALHATRAQYLAALRAPPSAPQPPVPWAEAEAMERTLLAGDQRSALAIMDDCLARGCNLIVFEMHVIQPAMHRIGEKWQANQVTVAQEHLATAIVHSLMSVGLLRAPTPNRVMVGCCSHASTAKITRSAFRR